MGLHTKIEWVVAVARAMGPDAVPATWNPIGGCSRASDGCKHCYAAAIAHRFGAKGNGTYAGLTDLDPAGIPRFNGTVRLEEGRMDWPLKERARMAVFVCDMADLFHDAVEDAWLDRIFGVMASRPDCIFMLVTKRPARMNRYITGLRDAPRYLPIGDGTTAWSPYENNVPTNIWIGTTVESQAMADERIPHLLSTPAAVRFVSCEPLLGPVDLRPWLHDSTCLVADGDCTCSEPREVHVDWVITGGESGPGARPMHPDWARSVRDQCDPNEVPFFFKQWGDWAPGECCPPPTRIERTADLINDEWSFGRLSPRAMEELHCDDEPDVYRVGKSRAGRHLDSQIHDAVPEVRHV